MAPKFDRLEGDRLFADPDQVVRKKAPADLLQLFIALPKTSNKTAAVERFATRWGVLALCRRHGLPEAHSPGCIGGDYPRPGKAPIDWERDPGYFARSSVTAYIKFASLFESLLNIGIALTRGAPGAKADWDQADMVLNAIPPWGSKELHRRKEVHRRNVLDSVGTARSEYEFMLNKLLEICNVRPFLFRDGSHWNIVLNAGYYYNLQAILAVRLILKLSGASEQRKCDSPTCPNGFFIPRHGNQKYCPDCGKTASWRKATKKYSSSKKESSTLGKTIGSKVRKQAKIPSKRSKKN